MNKFVGGYTVPNFKVSVTLGMVKVQGQVVRHEIATGIVLATKEGVTRYIKECGNLVSLRVTDLNTGKDITEECKQFATFVPGRYRGGVDFIDMRQI